MPVPFDSAFLKLTWGQKHIDLLRREIQTFLQVPPGECFAEPDPDNPNHMLQKIRLTRSIPEYFSLITGDAVDNLRAALDHAVYAVAITAHGNGSKIEHANFPFAGSAAHLEIKLKGLKDIPKEMWPLFRGFQPYPGGNYSLVALNRACNRNKHALLVSLVGIPKILDVNMSGTGLVRFPSAHVWDRAKNEMLLFTEDAGSHREGYFDLQFLIALTGIAENDQVYLTLDAFASEVQRTLHAIDTDARRLGVF